MSCPPPLNQGAQDRPSPLSKTAFLRGRKRVSQPCTITSSLSAVTLLLKRERRIESLACQSEHASQVHRAVAH